MTRKSLLLVALLMVLVAVWSVPPTEACLFCNVTGYAVCQTTDGTACPVNGVSKRCIMAPECYCEWGVCRCLNGVWSCIY